MRKTKTTWLSVLIILFTFSGNAQEQAPKIDQSITKFSKYMGAWHANANLTSEGKTYVIDYTVTIRPIGDGHGVSMEEVAKSKEVGDYYCTNLVGYDPFAKKLHWYSVDNTGTAHDHFCFWKSPDHFALSHNSVRDGKKYNESIDMVFKGENSMKVNFTVKLDGVVTQKSEGTFERISKL
jgi:hypothetical protein